MLLQAQLGGSPNGFLRGLRRFAFASPIYNYSLLGRVPDRLLGTPPELLPGNASAGQAILSGFLIFGGRRYSLPSFTSLADNLPEEWISHLHGFTWLADLRSIGSTKARLRAQFLLEDWVNQFDRWEPFFWRPSITGSRLVSWITHFAFFAAESDSQFKTALLSSLSRQSRHLSRSVHLTGGGLEAIDAQKGLIYSGIALPECDHYLAQGLELLESESEKQILSDGGHVSRNPYAQLHMIKSFLEIREALIAAHIDIPYWLNNKIKRMAPFTRALRVGDGTLARFNGGIGGDPEVIDLIIDKTRTKGKPLLTAPHSGFHRVSSGKTVVVMDAGAPPDDKSNYWGHAGTLSFEMSAGKERVIVNCGSSGQMGDEWRQALRTTAAHSTIVVDDVNSVQLGKRGGLSRMPVNVNCSRRETNGASILEASSDGYRDLFDLDYRRILILSPDGKELKGEDLIVGKGGRHFAVRFHLHPNVQATLIQNGHAALLKPRRGRGWKFISPDREVLLEDSIYIEDDSRHRRTHQIVIQGALSGSGAAIRWQLTQI